MVTWGSFISQKEMSYGAVMPELQVRWRGGKGQKTVSLWVHNIQDRVTAEIRQPITTECDSVDFLSNAELPSPGRSHITASID